MNQILTLIAGSKAQPLDEASIANICTALPAPGKIRWLADGEACDIAFEIKEHELGATRDRVREALQDTAIDFVCQQARSRRKRLLIADMDSTLIAQECIDEIADYMGIKPKIAQITERTMRGELEFEPSLRERVSLLKGLEEKTLQIIFEDQITLNPGARTLARTMGAHGAHTVIVSGGFTYFTSRIAQAAGFDEHHANDFKITKGKLTGLVREPILGQQAKLEALRKYRKTLGLDPGDTLCVGDGANDLAMLGEAGLGVAYHAKPVVAAQADARIDHCDLTALLFAQGYRRSEFNE